MEATVSNNSKIKRVYDPLYGFIQITPIEWEIIHTPFYQRLRWIKQIGFSFYTFPGAEHSRFGHSIGVMHNSHEILKSIGRGVNDRALFDESKTSNEKIFHQSIRLAALMHDLGTFCFSHTTEMSYIRFGETTNSKNSKGHPDDHEHLGSYIIKNTDYESGITHVLKKYGYDPQKISDLVKGTSEDVLANQILHSEIDCDRMDYLLRDAHYTGLNYGTYDRAYLLHHFTTVDVGGNDVLAIKHNALHCVEDFLSARFAWYSQVVRSARGAKFDALAEELTFYLLEKGKIFTYSQLLKMISDDPVGFYKFNDTYFMQLVHSLYYDGELDKDPRIKEIAECLLFEKSPKTIRCEELKQRILNQDDTQSIDRYYKKATDKVEEIKDVLKKNGSKSDWIVEDIPTKLITFVNSKKRIIKKNNGPNLLLERDPTKVLDEDGNAKLLVDIENSIIFQLQEKMNFIPNVYCSDSAYQLLQDKGVIP
jgi:HD superfamily phosphohydrolase